MRQYCLHIQIFSYSFKGIFLLVSSNMLFEDMHKFNLDDSSVLPAAILRRQRFLHFSTVSPLCYGSNSIGLIIKQKAFRNETHTHAHQRKERMCHEESFDDDNSNAYYKMLSIWKLMKHVTTDVMFSRIENRRSLIQPILDYKKKEKNAPPLVTYGKLSSMHEIDQTTNVIMWVVWMSSAVENMCRMKLPTQLIVCHASCMCLK